MEDSEKFFKAKIELVKGENKSAIFLVDDVEMVIIKKVHQQLDPMCIGRWLLKNLPKITREP